MTSRIDEATAEGAPVVIIGAGPAGLTAAYQLVKRGVCPLVLEKGGLVGGIARTEQHNGYRFDIGGHRFFTKVPEVEAFWHEVLDGEFLKVPRLSRIFYGGLFYNYPIELRNTLANLGLVESACILLSYLRWRVRPYPVEETFEQWVTNRFGPPALSHLLPHLHREGLGHSVQPDPRRLGGAANQGPLARRGRPRCVSGRHDTATLIKEFSYPRLGPGMMWERVRDRVEAAGGRVEMGAETVRLHREGPRITAVTASRGGARSDSTAAISSRRCRSTN